MKNMKRMKALALAVMLLGSLVLMCACTQNPGGSSTPAASNLPSGKITYKVTVIGVDGKPATSGMVVSFLRNGEQVALQTLDATGVAAKELEKGDYTVQLQFNSSDEKYYYDTSDLTLSATKTELTIELAYALGEQYEMLGVGAEGEFPAYYVNSGRTRVTLKAGQRTYFLFQPSEAGYYKLSTADDAYFTGYYGSPYFVQSDNAVDTVEGNASFVPVSADQISTGIYGTTVLVIGVDNPGSADVETLLYVERTGDYVISEVPTENYQGTHSMAPWTKPENVTINKFDLTAAAGTYELFVDEQGFYHLDSPTGPLVVVCLGENSESLMSYASPYDIMLQNTGVMKYIRDEQGNLVKREDYKNCLEAYIGVRDESEGVVYTGGCIDRESGLYPLTDDLMYIIQNHGEYSGWWENGSDNYLFNDMDGNPLPNITAENAWLFMCCYLTEN